MTFLNEYVPEADIEKYGLREINRRFFKGDFDYRWTIDRNRNIYLRSMGGSREYPNEEDFTFFWNNILMTIPLTRQGEGERGGKGSTTWSIRESKNQPWLPVGMEGRRQEIINDLKEALHAYKDFGVGSTIVDHTAYFKF